MTTWIEALKIWNGKREGKKYMIPRKGTEEHSQVMSIMKGQQNGNGLVQLGRKAKKEFNDNKEPKMNMEGGSLKKALNLAKEDPKQFVNIVNKLTQKGNGMKKKQKGGFLPAFIVPFIPSIVSALGTAAGAFATGAAGAAGAKLVDEIVGDGILDLITQNPQESIEVSKILSGAYMPPPPKIVDGKLQIQKGPVENLISSIFG